MILSIRSRISFSCSMDSSSQAFICNPTELSPAFIWRMASLMERQFWASVADIGVDAMREGSFSRNLFCMPEWMIFPASACSLFNSFLVFSRFFVDRVRFDFASYALPGVVVSCARLWLSHCCFSCCRVRTCLRSACNCCLYAPYSSLTASCASSMEQCCSCMYA